MIEGGNFFMVKIKQNNKNYENFFCLKNYEEKMKEQEDKVSTLPKFGVVKQITKSKNSSLLGMNKREEFISYESWKKFQEGGSLL